MHVSPRAVLVAATLALALPVPDAAACGGLFCDNNAAPTLQTSETILFEVPGDGTITVTVGISYSGSPENFSWIIPVRETPDLSVTHPNFLSLLDAATMPRFRLPELVCSYPDICGACDGAGMPEGGGDSSVHVRDLPAVGPYDPEVISSEDPGALIDWLDDNGYGVTSAMEPLIAEYVTSNMKFLGLKLTPGETVGSIAPLRMTYAGTTPSVPLRLTAVGARPDMAVSVVVAAATRYQPGNWPGFAVDRNNVRASALGGTNYGALVAWRIDERGGRAWVTEMAGPSRSVIEELEELGVDDREGMDEIRDLVDSYPMVTRFATRISPWEMTTDPTFVPSANPSIDRWIDLSGRPAQEFCPEGHDWEWGMPAPAFGACARSYCGEGDCVAGDVEPSGLWPESCLCPEGTALVFGNLGSTCAPTDADVMGGDPCAVNPNRCGERGACVPINGQAACVCPTGEAFLDGECTADFTRYEPARLLAPVENEIKAGCDAGCEGGGVDGAWLILVAPLLGWRRRPEDG